ncbi:MAG: hypothetical protein WBO23_10650 [Burkholderiales bacterium]
MDDIAGKYGRILASGEGARWRAGKTGTVKKSRAIFRIFATTASIVCNFSRRAVECEACKLVPAARPMI